MGDVLDRGSSHCEALKVEPRKVAGASRVRA